jgi:hypothetical protein
MRAPLQRVVGHSKFRRWRCVMTRTSPSLPLGEHGTWTNEPN